MHSKGADVEVIRGDEQSQSYNLVNRTTTLGGSSGGTKKIKKIRRKGKKKVEAEGDYDEDESYEKIIEKTKIIVKKGRKSKKGKEAYEDEYEEYEDEVADNEAYNGMQAIGVHSLYISSGLTIKHRVPKPATCTTWNGNKVKTFDGLIYTHSFRCSHTLLQDKIDGTIGIVLRACPSTVAMIAQQQPCPHALEIMMSNTKYILENISM